MEILERLPNQISGIGYFVKAYLSPAQWMKIDDLLDEGWNGLTYKEVAERLIIDWLQGMRSELIEMGLSQEDATDKGYYPGLFRKIFPKKPSQTKNDLRMDQPLVVELFSIPAYWIDELAKRKKYGENREDVVNKGLEFMLDKIT